jgi:hypothetical protein
MLHKLLNMKTDPTLKWFFMVLYAVKYHSLYAITAYYMICHQEKKKEKTRQP